MDSHELAWAAGFFDGEGWANRTGRGVQSRINQAGADGIPEVLGKFHRIVGVGRIKGPVFEEGKRPLYYWEATSRFDLGRVADLIGPWLCQVKRTQFERALGVQPPGATWPGTRSEELAWAGGFFDGEGSTYLMAHRTHPGRYAPAVDVPQSGPKGIPVALSRFRAALNNVGYMSGPHKFEWAEEPVSRWRAGAVDDVQLVLHRLMPFIGSVKREQARRVLMVVNTQPDLPRGNPAFGIAGSRFCLRGHDKWNARLRPYKSRGKNRGSLERRQCLECVREDARARYAARRDRSEKKSVNKEDTTC